MTHEMKIKIWLDDIRSPPDESWTWCKNAKEAIFLLDNSPVSIISFDHDLGEDSGSGYDVAKFIEQVTHCNNFQPIEWRIHSANSVGRKNIFMAMDSCEKVWGANKNPS